MQKYLKVKAETLEQAREKFQNEIPDNFFVKEKDEYKPEIKYHLYNQSTSSTYAIENAKKHLPNKYFIKEILNCEIIKDTNIYIPVKIRAGSKIEAKFLVKDYIENKYKTILDTTKGFYRSKQPQLIKKGFKGIFGIGTTLNTYEVEIYVYPLVLIEYKTWAVIKGKITDEKHIIGEKKVKIKEIQKSKKEEEKEERGKELKSKGFCSKCNEIVETYEDSFDYDDGWFTRECTRCKICGNIINYGNTTQN